MAIDTVAGKQSSQALCWRGGDPIRLALDLQVTDAGHFRAKKEI